MLPLITRLSSASSSVRNSRNDTGTPPRFSLRKNSISIASCLNRDVAWLSAANRGAARRNLLPLPELVPEGNGVRRTRGRQHQRFVSPFRKEGCDPPRRLPVEANATEIS